MSNLTPRVSCTGAKVLYEFRPQGLMPRFTMTHGTVRPSDLSDALKYIRKFKPSGGVRLPFECSRKGMTMRVFRSKAPLLTVLFTAILGLGACQMTALSPEDKKLFEDFDK